MTSEILQYVRSEDPRFNDVPDDDLIEYIGHADKGFLQDEDFKKSYQKVLRERLNPSSDQADQADQADQSGHVGSFFKSGAQGLAGVMAAVPKSIGILASGIDKTVFGKDTPPEDFDTYKLGQWVDSTAKFLFPVDDKARERWSSKIGQGLGSAGGFMAGGVAGQLAKAPTTGIALLGSMATSEEFYQDAKQSGASEEIALKAAYIGMGVGVTEILPLYKLLDRLTGGNVQAQRSIWKWVRQAMGAGVEEATQETFQKIAQNIVAGDNKFFLSLGYDPDRNAFKGIGESAAVGGATGIILSLLANAVGLKQRGRSTTEAAPEAETKTPPTEAASEAEAKTPPTETTTPITDSVVLEEADRVNVGRSLEDVIKGAPPLPDEYRTSPPDVLVPRSEELETDTLPEYELPVEPTATSEPKTEPVPESEKPPALEADPKKEKFIGAAKKASAFDDPEGLKSWADKALKNGYITEADHKEVIRLREEAIAEAKREQEPGEEIEHDVSGVWQKLWDVLKPVDAASIVDNVFENAYPRTEFEAESPSLDFSKASKEVEGSKPPLSSELEAAPPVFPTYEFPTGKNDFTPKSHRTAKNSLSGSPISKVTVNGNTVYITSEDTDEGKSWYVTDHSGDKLLDVFGNPLPAEKSMQRQFPSKKAVIDALKENATYNPTKEEAEATEEKFKEIQSKLDQLVTLYATQPVETIAEKDPIEQSRAEQMRFGGSHQVAEEYARLTEELEQIKKELQRQGRLDQVQKVADAVRRYEAELLRKLKEEIAHPTQEAERLSDEITSLTQEVAELNDGLKVPYPGQVALQVDFSQKLEELDQQIASKQAELKAKQDEVVEKTLDEKEVKATLENRVPVVDEDLNILTDPYPETPSLITLGAVDPLFQASLRVGKDNKIEFTGSRMARLGRAIRVAFRGGHAKDIAVESQLKAKAFMDNLVAQAAKLTGSLEAELADIFKGVPADQRNIASVDEALQPLQFSSGDRQADLNLAPLNRILQNISLADTARLTDFAASLDAHKGKDYKVTEEDLNQARRVLENIVQLRRLSDYLHRQQIDLKEFEGSVADSFEINAGSYVTRSYKLFQKIFDWKWDTIPQHIKDNAVDFLTDKLLGKQKEVATEQAELDVEKKKVLADLQENATAQKGLDPTSIESRKLVAKRKELTQRKDRLTARQRSLSRKGKFKDPKTIQARQARQQKRNKELSDELKKVADKINAIQKKIRSLPATSNQLFDLNKEQAALNTQQAKLTKRLKNLEARQAKDAERLRFQIMTLEEVRAEAVEQAKELVRDRDQSFDWMMGSSATKGQLARLLRGRKDIPAPIRELLGEIKDPVARMYTTLLKQANLVIGFQVQNEVATTLVDLGLASPTKDKAKGFTQKVFQNSEGSELVQAAAKKYPSLQPLYTTPELHKQLVEFYNSHESRIPENLRLTAWFTGLIKKGIGLGKFLQVMISPKAYSTQYLSAFVNEAASGRVGGLFSLLKLDRFGKATGFSKAGINKKAAEILKESLKQKGTGEGVTSSEEKNAFLLMDGASFLENFKDILQTRPALLVELATEFGALSEPIDLRFLEDTLFTKRETDYYGSLDLNRAMTEAAGRLTKKQLASLAKTYAKDKATALTKVYGAGDRLGKFNAFLIESVNEAWANPEATMESIFERAGKITDATTPVGARVPTALREASNVGLSNTYMSWILELIRNRYNQAEIGRRYSESTNPRVKALGDKKLAALAITLATTTLLGRKAIEWMAQLAGGLDDEFTPEKGSIVKKWRLPPFHHNEDTALVMFGDQGFSYNVTSYILPDSVFMGPAVAASKGWSRGKAMEDATHALFDTYFGNVPLLGEVGETLFNVDVDKGGRKIYMEFDPWTTQMRDRLQHIYNNAFQSGLERMVRDSVKDPGERGNFGRMASWRETVLSLIGVRNYTYGWEGVIRGRMLAFDRAYRDINAHYSDAAIRKLKKQKTEKSLAEAKKLENEEAQLLQTVKDDYKAFFEDMVSLGKLSRKELDTLQRKAMVLADGNTRSINSKLVSASRQ